MTDDEKNRFVTDALVKIAKDSGVDVDSPGDDDETFDDDPSATAKAVAADTPAPDVESAPRVFRAPGQ
jgi:hypothetical protein